MTHITDEMVADKPSVDEIIQKFKAFVGDNILIGHNMKRSHSGQLKQTEQEKTWE
ncbi:MAG: hypothetical protein J6N19_04135 [Clostridium sp.]|nr:hypothetical protein [Clostridium sp.]